MNLSEFTLDNSFYGEIEFITAVKSFELGEIRKRYLESTKNKNIGSFKRREVSLGGIVAFKIKDGKVVEEKILLKTKEPRAIDVKEDKIAFASENKVFVIDNEEKFIIENEWFSYIHTVEFSKLKDDIILISSSGYDCFFEFNYKTGEKIYEWFAWENRYDTGIDNEKKQCILTRKEEVYKNNIQKGINCKLVDPKNGTLPTAQRTAFINSVSYSANESSYLVTFFHRGEVREISSSSDKVIFEGLQSPHGGKEIGDLKVATDTRGGRLVLKNNTEISEIIFNTLKGKPDYLEDKEWLQNSAYKNDVIIVIDSNRTSFVIINRKEKKYSLIPYNNDFAIQDMVIEKLSSKQLESIRSI